MDSTYNLACIYFHGEGTEVNYEKAKDLFEKASNKG